MQEVINCPSCQRKLQVPESLLGQDVQCPTCGATFVASLGGQGPGQGAPPMPPPRYSGSMPLEPESAPPPPPPRRERGPRRDDYDDYDDREYDEYDERPRRYRRRRDLAPHRGSTILTFGILSLVVFGPIFGPMAWIMGNNDLAEMKAGRMDPEGESATNAGRICGMIATIICIVGVALLCLCVPLAMMGGRVR